MKASILKSIIFVLTLFFSSSASNASIIKSEKNSTEEIVKHVITSQLAAFREKDIEKAYSFASPNIKKQFSDPRTFELMVRNGYPVIWKAKSYKFIKFSTKGKRSIQRVLFRSYKDALLTYDYLLEKFSVGWRISGVIPVKTEGSI